MATVTIRNLDNAVVERLKARAKLNNRSLEAELRQILDLASAHDANFDRAAVAEHIAGMSLKRSYEDSTELIRAERNR